MRAGDAGKTAVGTRWFLTWKLVEGVKTVKARLAAQGFQDPDPQDGAVDTSGRANLRPSDLQIVSLSALKNWKRWNLEIKNAC